ncbi:MAG: disulfide bond formation protein B [Succinivibrio sp.]|nr:disulfide bond formation protein B [Succinivibrio sp.]
MLQIMQSFSRTKICWALLFLVGVGLLCCGLAFQYYLRLDPCVNCVYERAYVCCFILAGVLGFIGSSLLLFRFIASLTLLASSVGGFITSLEHFKDTHLQDEKGLGLGASCQLNTNFPEFLPLDQYLPWIFKAQGTCKPLDWEFLSLDMPEWLLIIFFCGIIAGSLLLVAQFMRPKPRDFTSLYK